jgi:hypothetical protein
VPATLKLQKANAIRYNSETLRAILRAWSASSLPASDGALRAKAAQLVEDSQSGHLNTEDSCTLGALALAIARSIAEG